MEYGAGNVGEAAGLHGINRTALHGRMDMRKNLTKHRT